MEVWGVGGGKEGGVRKKKSRNGKTMCGAEWCGVVFKKVAGKQAMWCWEGKKTMIFDAMDLEQRGTEQRTRKDLWRASWLRDQKIRDIVLMLWGFEKKEERWWSMWVAGPQTFSVRLHGVPRLCLEKSNDGTPDGGLLKKQRRPSMCGRRTKTKVQKGHGLCLSCALRKITSSLMAWSFKNNAHPDYMVGH